MQTIGLTFENVSDINLNFCFLTLYKTNPKQILQFHCCNLGVSLLLQLECNYPFFLTLKSLPHNQSLLTTLKEMNFESIVGKEENAGNQHFILFQQYNINLSISSIKNVVCECFKFGPVQKQLSFG